MSAADQAGARGFEFPSAFTILFALMALAALATWILPAGQYDRIEDAALGRAVAVAGSYHAVAANPQGWADLIMAPVAGFYDAATEKTRAVDVVLFVLILGGFMGVIGKTGALDAAVASISRALAGREIWMIPPLSALFAIGGATFGMAEETLPFCMLLAPIMLRAGYDTIVAIAVVLVGSSIGALAGVMNPFATIIASNAAGVPFTEGMGLRFFLLIAVWAVSAAYIMRYAVRIKADPARSLLARERAAIEAAFPAAPADAPAALSRRQSAILALFVLTFGAMIWGVSSQGWWMAEMSSLFLAGAIAAALVWGMRERAFVEIFLEGARGLLGVALIVGVARGVLVLMDEGRITDTVLHAGEGALAALPGIAFINVMLGIEVAMSFIVPSSSGHAVLTMPILAPLADFAGVERALVVTAYQAGNGIVCILTPTSAVLMGSIAIGRIPFHRWLQFAAPLALLLLLTCMAALSAAVTFGL